MKSIRKNHVVLSALSLAGLACSASGASIALVNSDFSGDGPQASEEINLLPTGWTGSTPKFYDLNVDGDGDPTADSGAQNRIWSGWTAADGFYQIGFQGVSAISQDSGTNFVAGQDYTFTVWVGSTFEGANQDIQATIGSGGSALNTATFTDDFTGGLASQSFSVSYTALPTDDGNEIQVTVGSLGGSGTAVVSRVALSSVPEPSSALLLGLGGVALLFRRKV